GRGEMQLDPWVAGQPGPDPGMGVGAVVVEHEVQLPPRIGPGDLFAEGQELDVAVPVKAAVGHLAGGHLQGGKQRGGAVADVVVGAPRGQTPPQGAGGAGAVPGPGGGALVPARRPRTCIWAFSYTHSTTAFSGGCRYSPTTSWILASSCGSVENLKVSV